MPRGGARIVLKIMAPERPILTDRSTNRPLAQGISWLHGDLDPIGILPANSGGRHRADHSCCVVNHSNPRHLHSAEFHQIAADGRQEILRTGGTHDRLVAMAEGRVELSEALDSDLGCLALGDV